MKLAVLRFFIRFAPKESQRVFALTLIVGAACGLARHFRPVPIYEALLEQDDIHLPHRAKSVAHALEQIRVSDAMQTDAIVLPANLTIAKAVGRTENYEFTTFPVVDEHSRCVGVITEMSLCFDCGLFVLF